MVIEKDALFLLTSADGGKKAFGTGFAVAYKDGLLYLLTCAHVVDQLDGRVKVGRHKAEAEILAKGSADGIDLALLRIPCGQPPPLLNHAFLGKEGMKFEICGYGPFAGAKDNYVLRHIEGKLGKSIAFESPGSGRVEAWDLHVEDDDFSRLQGGYSGSPLCNKEGGLLAVVSHKVDAGQRGHAVAIANLKIIYPDVIHLMTLLHEHNKNNKIKSKFSLLNLVKLNIKIFTSGISFIITIMTIFSFFPQLKYYAFHFFGKTPELSKSYTDDVAWDIKESDPSTRIKIVYVPGGCFQMGSSRNDQERQTNEEPANEICISSFWMGQYEITQSQWEKIKGINPAFFHKKGENYPVERVSFEEVQDFVDKLNKKTGKNFRLPTEAEWEYAARAGTKTSRYWGDEKNACDKAMYENHPAENNHNDDYRLCVDFVISKGLNKDCTAPVGSYPPNKFGLHDMLGNVWEWCSDWYKEDYYLSIQRENPVGPSSGTERVIRGGCWRDGSGIIRSAFRKGFDPKVGVRTIGFRIVLPSQKQRD